MEYLRLKVLELDEEPKALRALAMEHFPKLFVLCDAVGAVHPKETRTDILLSQIETKVRLGWSDKGQSAIDAFAADHFMELLDLVCRIRQLTNQDKVRQLIDSYDGGWSGETTA